MSDDFHARCDRLESELDSLLSPEELARIQEAERKAKSPTVQLEFSLTNGLVLCEEFGSAEADDGTKIALILTVGGGCVGVRISPREGPRVTYMLRPDTLGTAVYEHWRASR